jgi:hypothetical protein
MGQMYQYWWRICQEINVFFFHIRISHVLRIISICNLFTDPPSHLDMCSTIHQTNNFICNKCRPNIKTVRYESIKDVFNNCATLIHSCSGI